MSQAPQNFSRLAWEVIEHHESVAHSGTLTSVMHVRVTEIRRAPVPGGWLVQAFDMSEMRAHHGNAAGVGGGLTFIPDPAHEWRF